MTAEAIHILLVEDNPGDQRLTKEAFYEGKLVNTIEAVDDGEKALAYLRKEGEYSSCATPDIVLLDLNLPRVDGREVLKEIKNDPKLKKIPVVILTTSEADEDITNAYDNHANCYIRKPVDLEKFVSVVQKIEAFWLSIVRLPSEVKS